MGDSEHRGPEYSTLNSRILIIRIPQNKVPLIFVNSHICTWSLVRLSRTRIIPQMPTIVGGHIPYLKGTGRVLNRKGIWEFPKK